MVELVGGVGPQSADHLLSTFGDEMLVLVHPGVDDAQDFEHRVREVEVPPAGSEADLPEHLAVTVRQTLERVGRGDEVVERALIPLFDQFRPDLADRIGVFGPHGVLHGGERGVLL